MKYKDAWVHIRNVQQHGALVLYNINACDIQQSLYYEMIRLKHKHASHSNDSDHEHENNNDSMTLPDTRCYMDTFNALIPTTTADAHTSDHSGDNHNHRIKPKQNMSDKHIDMMRDTLIHAFNSPIVAAADDNAHGRHNDVDSNTIAPVSVRFEFDLIIFNHPHSGVEDLQRHRLLLYHFFHSAAQCASASTPSSSPYSHNAADTNNTSDADDTHHRLHVIVSLCDTQPERWHLCEAASYHHFHLKRRSVYDPHELPTWQVRRHHRDLAFTNRIEQQHVFVFVYDRDDHDAASTIKRTSTDSYCAVCDTEFHDMKRMQQHIHALQPRSSHPYHHDDDGSTSSIYQCYECKRTFVDQRSIEQHQRSSGHSNHAANG